MLAPLHCYGSCVYNTPPFLLPQLCLLAKCFKPVLPFLEQDMMDICKENGAYDAKHFLCYYYYGGMIYTGLKNFERALYFYEQVGLRFALNLIVTWNLKAQCLNGICYKENPIG